MFQLQSKKNGLNSVRLDLGFSFLHPLAIARNNQKHIPASNIEKTISRKI